MGEGGVGGLPFRSQASSLEVIYQLLSLTDKESVIVSTVIPTHPSGKQGEIKSAQVLTRVLGSLSP